MKINLSTLFTLLATLTAGGLHLWCHLLSEENSLASLFTAEGFAYLFTDSPFGMKLCAVAGLAFLLTALILAFCASTVPVPCDRRYNGIAALATIYICLISTYQQFAATLLWVRTGQAFGLVQILSYAELLLIILLTVGLCMDFFLSETRWTRWLLWIFPVLVVWKGLPVLADLFSSETSPDWFSLVLLASFLLFSVCYVLWHFTRGLARKTAYLFNALTLLLYTLALIPHYASLQTDLWQNANLGTDLAAWIFLLALLIELTGRLSPKIEEEPVELPPSLALSDAEWATALTFPVTEQPAEPEISSVPQTVESIPPTPQPEIPAQPEPSTKPETPSILPPVPHLQVEPEEISVPIADPVPAVKPTPAPQKPVQPAPTDLVPAVKPTPAPQKPVQPTPVKKTPPVKKKASREDMLAALNRQITHDPKSPPRS